MTVLFAYDGSDSADAAITAAGSLLTRQDGGSVVVSVWDPAIVEGLRAVKFGAPPAIAMDAAQQDERAEHQARLVAERGTRLADQAGFRARARWVAEKKHVADTIVAVADELDADVIILGARGLTGLAAFTGSVSIHVLEHAQRPVLIVPPKPASHAATAEGTVGGWRDRG
jgi:nucleotide-binding universal stress UspA family protein